MQRVIVVNYFLLIIKKLFLKWIINLLKLVKSQNSFYYLQNYYFKLFHMKIIILKKLKKQNLLNFILFLKYLFYQFLCSIDYFFFMIEKNLRKSLSFKRNPSWFKFLKFYFWFNWYNTEGLLKNSKKTQECFF